MNRPLTQKAIVVLASDLLTQIVMPWINSHGGIGATRLGRRRDDAMPETSALDRLAFDVSSYTNELPDSIRKRLEKMRSGAITVVPANVADAFALACGSLAAYSELTHLPATKDGARTMVNEWAAVNEPEITARERLALANKLLRFASGVIEAYDTDTARAARVRERLATETRRNLRLAEAA